MSTAADVLLQLHRIARDYHRDCVLLRRAILDPAKLHLALLSAGERYDAQRTQILTEQRAAVEDAMRTLEADDVDSHVSPEHRERGRKARTYWRRQSIKR